MAKDFPNVSEMLPHQIEVLTDPTPFKTLIWHRRSRKTSTAINKLIIEALHPQKPPGVVWHVFPTHREAKDAVWMDPAMLFGIMPDGVIDRINISDLTVKFVNGSVLMLKSADHPDSLRGSGPRMIVLDEFATMESRVYDEICFPIVLQNHGQLWVIGTPKGKNHLYEHYLRGQKGDPNFKSWYLPASKSNILTPLQLKMARELSKNTYLQEYECKWLEHSGVVFRGIEEIAVLSPQRPIPSVLYVAGVDLAKHKDYTVISIFRTDTNEQVYMGRWQQYNWPYQVKKLKALSKLYNDCLLVVEGSGIGDTIVDQLNLEEVPTTNFLTTAKSKRMMIEKLSIFIETFRIKLLHDEQLIKEFQDFTYKMGPNGHVYYGAISGSHDDIPMSIALAISYLYKPDITKTVIRNTSRISRHKNALLSGEYDKRQEESEMSEFEDSIDW